jgi:glycosyltransferase involved in cell wall biosynthesis
MLGTRGVPAAHGGFETAAENVGRHLVAAGWRVVVYCQADGPGSVTEDRWHGLERVIIPVSSPGARGTAEFDLVAARHAARFDDVCLVFGYNTAVFNLLQRFHRTPLIFNMDGLEWQRARWGPLKRAFLYANERIAALSGHALIADHPEIERYLHRRAPANKITMIPYGADAVTSAPTAQVRDLGLEPGGYFTLICRPVNENSILEIVRGFSVRHRGAKLASLGNYDGETNDYHRAVLQAAGPEVVFLGSIYESEVTQALRFHSLGYLHGHTVGGTNPSLVEAMAVGNPVIAHDNPYNRWVAGDGGVYFRTTEDVDRLVGDLLSHPDRSYELGSNSRIRHAQLFTWERVAAQYEELAAQFTRSEPRKLASVRRP